MSKSRKATAKPKGSTRFAPAGGWDAFASRAYDAGRKAAREQNGGLDYSWKWDDLKPTQKAGFVALVKFVVRESRRPNAPDQRPEP